MFNIGDLVEFTDEGILDHQLDQNPSYANRFFIVSYLDSGDDFAYLVESDPEYNENFLTFAANDDQIRYIQK